MNKLQLTGNQLKMIALVAMTVDHAGWLLFPQSVVMRIIGRLAFPIYAYMIAEGCRYTRSMGRYLGMLAAVGGMCSLVYLLAMGSLYQCIFVTFTLSVGMIFLIQTARKKGTRLSWLLVLGGLLLVLLITEGLPRVLRGTDFSVDYGFLGVLLPVAVYLAGGRRRKLLVAAVMLVLLGSNNGWVQYFGLLALPLLALYNGQRGKRNMKYLFYLYYPIHLVVLYAMAQM